MRNSPLDPLAALCALLLAMVLPAAQTLRAQTRAAIPLPPMGWSSWNSFSNTIDSHITQAQAQAMIASGMQKAGYHYINIDEGWWLGHRDPAGNIVVDPKAWPPIAPGEQAGDMANIVRYLHSLGLKAGIYTDAGKDGCSTVGPDLGPSYPGTGSEGHYEQDFLQFAKWGFDYVKVDWCGGDKEKLDPAVQYSEIARAIALAETATGRKLYYSICNWGRESPWTWAPGIGGVHADIWRTSGDIVAPIVANTKNAGRKASFSGMLGNFDQGIHPEAQHTGYYNDPDMMVIGMPGLTDAQNRVHMALWAISGAPLLVGADLTTLSEATRATLTNPTVLAIDQDPLGLQATKVAEPAPGLEVWSKPLAAPGQRAVLVLNRTNASAATDIEWSALGLLQGPPASVVDVWKQTGSGGAPMSSYSITVAAQDAVLLIVSGKDAPPITYSPGRSFDRTYLATFAVRFSRSDVARIDIAYTNQAAETAFADLRVNGHTPTRIAFPPATGASATVAIQAVMDGDGGNNSLTFSAIGGAAPTIEGLTVH
jgi:hypothetical protein